jgi:hypothetical protein
MIVQWRATDSEDVSRWRCDPELAVLDAALMIADGEGGAEVERRKISVPVRDGKLTAEARRRAQKLLRENNIISLQR